MLEVACFSANAIHIAQSCGADRAEFCANYDLGGTTPPLDDLAAVADEITIPIHVMIRPRGGNFAYSEAEFEQMKVEITRFKSLADGMVFGILTWDGQVDTRRNAELVKLAAPLPCTFHRAFDQTVDLELALRDVANCHFSTVLSSGGQASALQGAEELQRLVQVAKGLGVEIMPGGGIRASNIQQVQRSTGAQWFHSAAIREGYVPSSEEIKLLRALSTMT